MIALILALALSDSTAGTPTLVETSDGAAAAAPAPIENTYLTGNLPPVDLSPSIPLTGIRLRNLPLGRSITSAIALAPGTVDRGLGDANLSISGGSPFENVIRLDGVPVVQPGFGSFGAYSPSYGTFLTRIAPELIDSVDVRDAGVEAEWDDALGGNVWLQTRRVDRPYEALVLGTIHPSALQENPTEQKDLTGTLDADDVLAMASGYLVPGHVTFLVAADPGSQTLTRRAPAGYPLASLGAERTRRADVPYFAKVDATLGTFGRLEAFAYGDGGSSPNGPQLASDLLEYSTASYARLGYGSQMQAVRWSYSFSRALSFSLTGSTGSTWFREQPSVDETRTVDLRPLESGTGGPIVSGGIGYYERTSTAGARRIELKLSSLLGPHDLEYGAMVERAEYAGAPQYTGRSGYSFVDAQGVTREITSGVSTEIRFADDGSTVFRLLRGYTTPLQRRSYSTIPAAFVQDRWSLGAFELKGGFRLARQTIAGNAVHTFPLQLEPRVGASWAEGPIALSMSAGRLVEQVPLRFAYRDLRTTSGVSRLDYYDPALSQQIPEGVDPVAGSTQHLREFEQAPTPIDRGATPNVEDEAVVAVQWGVGTTRLGVRAMHRQLERVLEDYQTATADEYVNGTSNIEPYFVGNPGRRLDGTCLPPYPRCWTDPKRIYQALELTVTRPVGTAGKVAASYRLSRLFGNYDGLTANVGDDPNASLALDFPNHTPLMASTGRTRTLPGDRTHQLIVSAMWEPTAGLTVGGIGRFSSGAPRTRYYANPVYETPGALPRGSDGREPAAWSIDARVGWSQPLRSGLELLLRADVFNVLDTQTVTAHDEDYELGPGLLNANYGDPIAWQSPRAIELSAGVSFR